MDEINEKIIFFNIFKETAANNIGLIRGFSNWVTKMSYYIDGNDLVIRIPPVLINRGTKENIEKSKRKQEVYDYMGKKDFTYLEYVIRASIDRYAMAKDKKVSSMQKQKG